MNHDCRGGDGVARWKLALAACKTLALIAQPNAALGTGLLRCCHTSSNRLFLGLLAWLLLAFAATNRLGQRVGTARHSGSKASRGAAGI